MFSRNHYHLCPFMLHCRATRRICPQTAMASLQLVHCANWRSWLSASHKESAMSNGTIIEELKSKLRYRSNRWSIVSSRYWRFIIIHIVLRRGFLAWLYGRGAHQRGICPSHNIVEYIFVPETCFVACFAIFVFMRRSCWRFDAAKEDNMWCR